MYELWKQIDVPRSARDEPRTPVDQLRDLLIRLSEHWESYRIFDWQPEVPWTNNGTEQVIGRMKMRSRTVRSYKVWKGSQLDTGWERIVLKTEAKNGGIPPCDEFLNSPTNFGTNTQSGVFGLLIPLFYWWLLR